MAIRRPLVSLFLLPLVLALPAAPASAGTLGTFTSDAQGFDTHTYYYDDGQEVTVIDTQFVPALTQAMVDQIRSKTQSPITRVVVTHPNPDKFNGLPLLHALGAESIASQATASAMPGVHAYKKHFWVHVGKLFTEASYPAFEPVRTTFSGQLTVRLKSGETLSLFELKNPGVASTQTVVRLDRSGDLIVGDLVHYRAHAWLEGGIVDGAPRPDLAKWRAAVGELSALGGANKAARVYGGRGDAGAVAEVVAFQQDYLARADALVTGYVAQAGAAGLAELRDPAKAQAHYAALQRRFEQQFPGLKLPYLVGYGVYGLVNSKLK
jgi:glyoxylase-like metal-dependent hydrolase (beta-lactamase superfamily II)